MALRVRQIMTPPGVTPLTRCPAGLRLHCQQLLLTIAVPHVPILSISLMLCCTAGKPFRHCKHIHFHSHDDSLYGVKTHCMDGRVLYSPADADA